MADIQANIGVNIETGAALAQLKQLQREISAFHTQMAKGGAAAQAATANMQQNLINSINATGKFNAGLTRVKTTTETFTNALEKNKLSMGQYFKFGVASTKTFGKFFTTEFDTINKVARERVKDLQTQYIKMGRDANGAMQAIAVRPLALDMNDLGTKTAIAAQKQQLFNQLLKQGSTNLLNFGKNTQWAGRQLMVGFTIPLTILGTTASRVFMEMEKQAIAFRKVYGDLFTGQGERDKALQDIQQLGEEFTKFGIAVADTIGLAAEAAAAGFSGADLQAQTAQATKLSILGQIETQKALETTIALQSAFKMSNEELAESINFLNAVENQTVVSLDDITTAIPKVAPVVMSLGGNIKDLAFFMAAMKEGGINASEGANALKSSLAAIINPTEKSSQFMASLGINIRGIVDQNAGDLMGTMMGVAKALDELDPLNRSRAIEQLFGKFQFARISTLFNNITKQGTQAYRVSELAGASIEELANLSEGELAVVSESTTAKFEGAFERLKAQLAPVGEEFLRLATPFIEFGTKVLEAFNGMGDGTKRIVMGVITLVGAIGPVALMAFGLLMNGVANLIKTFAVLRNVFTGNQQSAQMLGQQFDYMTQEQIQAASVAASLDQVHTNLIQTFTSEASSVDRLRIAYEKAIATQRNFRGPIISGGKSVSPKGFAEGGIIKGPGTGTSDSIPVLVSNGEAIIPAESVARNPEAVNMLISGNLKKFKNGGIVGSSQASESAIVASHFDIMSPSNLGQTISELGDALDDLKVSMFNLSESTDGTQIVIDKFEGSLSELADSNKNVMAGGTAFSGTTRAGTGSRNAMFNALGISGEAFDIDSLIAQSKIAEKAKKENSRAYQKHTAEIERLIVEGQEARLLLSQNNDQSKIKYQYMRQNAEATIKESLLQRRGMTIEEASIQTDKLLSGLDKQYATLRASGISEEKALSQARKQLIKSMLASGTNQFAQASASFGTDPLRAFVTGKGRASGDTREISRTFEGQRNPVAGRSSRQIVRDTGLQYQSAGQEMVKIANEELARGVKKAARSSSPSRAMRQEGKNLVDGLIEGVRSGKGRVKEAAGIDGSERGAVPLAGNFEKLNRGILTASFAMTSLSSIAMFAGGQTGKFAEFISKASMTLFALSGAAELASIALRSTAGKKVLDRISSSPAIAGAAAGAAGAKAAGGGIGAQAMGAARALVAIIPGVFGVISAFGILATGLFALTKEYLKQKKEVEGLGKAANMSAKKIESFAGVFGIQTKESRFDQPLIAGDVERQLTTGSLKQQIKESGDILNEYQDEIIGLKAATDEQAEIALRSLATQLTSRGFAKEQIDALTEILAEEAGKKDLNLDFASVGITTQQGVQQAVNDFAKMAKDLSQAFPVELETTTIAPSVDFGGPALPTSGTLIDQEDQQAISLAAGSAASIISALNTELQSLTITDEKFNQIFDDTVGKLFEGANAGGVAAQTFKELAENLNIDPSLIDGLENASEFVLVLKAATAGVDVKKIQNYVSAVKNFNKERTGENAKSVKVAEDQLNKSILSGIQNYKSYADSVQQAEQARVQATATADLLNSLENENLALQNQNLVKGFLAQTNATVAETNFILANSSIVAGIAFAEEAERGEILANVLNSIRAGAFGFTSQASSGAGAAQQQTSAIDKLTQSLRDVVSINTRVTEGFGASSKAIQETISGTTSGFNGLSQSLRNMGASEDLIDLIVGMPPEEFNKVKNKLFNFNPATKAISGLKNEAKNLAKALNTIAIGEYLEEQRSFIINTKNQITAITRLRNAGLSYADALKVVQNQSIATAIATAATAAELREILRITQEVSNMQAAMDRESERSQVSESIRASNKEYSNQAAVLSKLAREQGSYSDAQISAILNDPDLATLFLNPSIDPGALRTALKQAEQRANLELKIRISTESGRLEVFDEYIGEINDYFSREENKIEIDFAIATKADQGIIDEAQNRIAAIQFEIDDYQAQLRGIEEQESAINEKYADRSKALDQVAKANERINRSQQAQLNIADALSRGDIAAAARAQQDFRSQQAQASVETSRETLQRQQAAELANIRSQSGLSREDIDARVKSLQNEIFGIEESQLEPAQERIRIAEYNKQLQIDALTVSGKTQEQWEQISNLTARAAQDTDAFATNIERALGLYEYFVNGVELSRDLFGEIEAELKNIGIDLPKATNPPPSTATPSSNNQSGSTNTRNWLDDQIEGKNKGYNDWLQGLKDNAEQKKKTEEVQAKERAGNLAGTPASIPATKNAPATTVINKNTKSSAITPAMATTRVIVNNSKLSNSSFASVVKSDDRMLNRLKTAAGGMIIPKGMNVGGKVMGYSAGGFSMGSDIVPAMLTPGEFVVRKRAVQDFGAENLEKINSGSYSGGSVYNYNLAVNVKSESDPNKIARTVIAQIKQVENQKIRGNRI